MKVLLGGLLLAALTACAPNKGMLASQSDTAIIGGEEVQGNDPITTSTVALYAQHVKTKKGYLCTGTLVSPQFIVTAGHCLPTDDETQVVVVFDLKLSKTSKMLPVVAASVHPRYVRMENLFNVPPNMRDKEDIAELKEWGRGDIALIRFAGKVPQGYEPAQIASTLKFLDDGSVVTLAGYGRENVSKDPDKDDGSGTLRRVDMPIAAVGFNKGEILIDKVRGKSACMGDSGGPALLQRRDGKYIVFGVTSAGLGDGADTCTTYVSYTSIPAYLPWLERAAAALADVDARDSRRGDNFIPIQVDVPDKVPQRRVSGL